MGAGTPTMWPFKRKPAGKSWEPPKPAFEFGIYCAAKVLPPLFSIVNPEGRDGALTGFPAPMRPGITPEMLVEGPMQAGDYGIMFGGECVLSLHVEAVDPAARLDSRLPSQEFWPLARLTPPMASRIERASWIIWVALVEPGTDVPESVLQAMKLADAITDCAEGTVFDTAAQRYFDSKSWKVSDSNHGVFVLDHVTIHAEITERRPVQWIHTHGMIKFGRPDFEIYEVPESIADDAIEELLNLAQYVIEGALVRPSETVGIPDQPLHARVGTRNRKDHWNDTPVLELVDVDDDRNPVATGAVRGLKALLQSRPPEES